MSDKKTIKINPELFQFSTTHKTRKKRQTDPNKPIRIKSDRHNRSVKNTKNQLLKYIREQQEQNYKLFSEKSTLADIIPSETKTSSEESFQSDFENSLKYLSSVAEKSQQSRQTNHNHTMRKYPDTSALLNSTLGNVIAYDSVDLNVPDVFSNIEPIAQDTIKLMPRNPFPPAPKYGCMKNGVLPTYRSWKNQTMKVSSNHGGQSTPLSSISTMTPHISPSISITGEGSRIESSPTTPTQSNTRPPFQFKPEFSGSNISGGSRKPNILEDIRAHQPIRQLQKQRIKRRLREQKQKRILRRTFRVGKSKHYPNVAVLISNKTLRNNITTKTQLLKQVPIEEVKRILMKKGFIKVGTTAPNNVLRKMYESISLICGDIQNHNPDNLLFNYFNAGDKL
jgi:hypothetical protein